MSKQRKWQHKMVKEKKCPLCGKLCAPYYYCKEHLAYHKERMQKKRAAQQSVQPTGGTVPPANIDQRPEVDSAGEDNQRPATSG